MTLDNWMDIPDDGYDPEPDESEDDRLYDDEERGRIKYHSQQGDLSTLLVTLGQTGPQLESTLRDQFGTPGGIIGHYEAHETFTNIDGIGPARNEELEAAVPIIKEALPPDFEIVYFLTCNSCDAMVKSRDPDSDCPECDAKVMQTHNFVGAAELAQALEEADLPDHIDITRLDPHHAYELLDKYGD